MTLDYETAHAAAQRAVAAMGPEFVYANGDGRCAYVRTDDPRFPVRRNDIPATGADKTPCLVGRILDDVGLLTDEIAGSIEGVNRLVEKGLLHVHPQALRFLSCLQGWQDSGATWGKALEHAERAARL